MFKPILRSGVLVLLLTALPAAVAASAASSSPSPAQMRAAVARAERSQQLWLTINICNTPRHPHKVGIRGEMPTLGFSSSLVMRIQVYYYSKLRHGYEPVPTAHMTIALGQFSQGLRQDGVTYKFKPPVLLRARATFQWWRGGRLLGQSERWTGSGYRHVDYADPVGYSARSCMIR